MKEALLVIIKCILIAFVFVGWFVLAVMAGKLLYYGIKFCWNLI